MGRGCATHLAFRNLAIALLIAWPTPAWAHPPPSTGWRRPEYLVSESSGQLSNEVAPGADDQVPVSASSTAVTWRTLADCDDASGQHVNYDTGTNAWSCGTSGPGGLTGLANPSATIGLSVINGSATTALRSDGASALSQAIAPTWTSLHTFENNNLQITPDDVLLLQNISAATIGTRVQISPSQHFIGQAWNTTSAASNTSDFRLTLKPVSGAVTVGYLTFSSQNNGGGYNDIATLDDSGNLTLGISGVTTTALKINGATSGQVLFGPRAVAGTPTVITPDVTGVLNTIYTGSDTGGDDTYVIAPTYAPSAYRDGHLVILTATTANTGAATLDYGAGVATIVKRSATTLANNDIPAGGIAILVYNGTNLVLLNPAAH